GLVKWYVRKEFPPLLSMAHIGKVEVALACVGHPCIANFKGGRECVRTRRCVCTAKVKRTAIPLCPNINQVVEARIGWRGLDILLFPGKDDRLCLLLNLMLECC